MEYYLLTRPDKKKTFVLWQMSYQWNLLSRWYFVVILDILFLRSIGRLVDKGAGLAKRLRVWISQRSLVVLGKAYTLKMLLCDVRTTLHCRQHCKGHFCHPKGFSPGINSAEVKIVSCLDILLRQTRSVVVRRVWMVIIFFAEQIKMPPKNCGSCQKLVYPMDELKCLDKVDIFFFI